jgi:hypothetical protein
MRSCQWKAICGNLARDWNYLFRCVCSSHCSAWLRIDTRGDSNIYTGGSGAYFNHKKIMAIGEINELSARTWFTSGDQITKSLNVTVLQGVPKWNIRVFPLLPWRTVVNKNERRGQVFWGRSHFTGKLCVSNYTSRIFDHDFFNNFPLRFEWALSHIQRAEPAQLVQHGLLARGPGCLFSATSRGAGIA